MTWELAGRPLRRILVSRLRYLGDVAMSTVVIAALRRGDPELELGFLCEAPYAPLLASHPELTRLHVLAVRRRSADARARVPKTVSGGRGLYGTVAELRRCRYDLAVDLFFNPRSAVLLRLAAPPLRIGGTTAWRRRLYTHTVTEPSGERRRVLAEIARGGLVDHLGRLAPLRHSPSQLPFWDWLAQSYADRPLQPRVAVPPLADSAAAAALERFGIAPGDRYVVLAPAATWPSKEWELSQWQALADALASEPGWPLVVLTPPGRAGEWDTLSRSGCAVLPSLPLDEVLRLVGGAAMTVTVDGGVMHAAVAMAVPTLALFGPTDPSVWFPYVGNGPYRVVGSYPACHPCDRHTCAQFVCMPDLAPVRVVAEVRALLADAAPRATT